MGRSVSLGWAVLATFGCEGDGGLPWGPVHPEVVSGTVAASPANVLSVLVTAEVRGADSVAVRYGVSGREPEGITPWVVPVADAVMIPVLGLLPETEYALEPLVHGGGAVATGEPLKVTTGALPADLPGFVTSGSDPSPGFVAFSTGPYALVIDNGGRVVWYLRFPQGPGLNFQAQPTGRYVVRPPPDEPMEPPVWLEIDPLGHVTRTLECARALRARFHDLLAEPDGSYWILCDETRILDLSDVGGHPQARVTGTVVQHVDAAGTLLFEWSPFDHFEITDVEEAERMGPEVNWTHGNALDLDPDGHILVSFRNLSEITSIDRGTGAVIWRMGGLRNEFTFLDGPTPPFARQHSVRATAPGRLLLLDNLGDPEDTRARRFEYDPEARTARLVEAHGLQPPVVAGLGGTVQGLPGGRTLVAFGNGGHVAEFDAEGNVVWEIEGDPGYVFRAQRILSLYRPGMSYPR